MRGTTVKNIRRFVDIIISNTPEEERSGKTKRQMVNEVKKFWVGNPEKQKFVKLVLNGEIKD
jgi:glyceraldehyde-3-phosphate dehydrogenase/erythrose-4-phosphate dehydrogenase